MGWRLSTLRGMERLESMERRLALEHSSLWGLSPEHTRGDSKACVIHAFSHCNTYLPKCNI